VEPEVFCRITPNLPEESRVLPTASEIPSAGAEETGCEFTLFKEKGLIKLLDEAIEHFNKATLHETANEVHKVLLMLHESQRNYAALAERHLSLHKSFLNIEICNSAHNRVFGSFYRVGFFGKGFGEMDGKEYIYKEPKITRLGEIKDRLMAIYTERLGQERVRLWTRSAEVKREELEEGICYIQLTSVEPYFDKTEFEQRVTDYERNNNISRFIFETPFTASGGGQASHVRDQWRRKTILSTERHFPYVKTRLLITDKSEVTLTPIENSMEAIESKSLEIATELQGTPNLKTLQNKLQGTLRVQVNQGPQEICKTFLDPAGHYPEESVDRLRAAMKGLLSALNNAILLDQSLIDAHQLSFHQELVAGYDQLKLLVQQHGVSL